jgi:hypothetical protein
MGLDMSSRYVPPGSATPPARALAVYKVRRDLGLRPDDLHAYKAGPPTP